MSCGLRSRRTAEGASCVVSTSDDSSDFIPRDRRRCRLQWRRHDRRARGCRAALSAPNDSTRRSSCRSPSRHLQGFPADASLPRIESESPESPTVRADDKVWKSHRLLRPGRTLSTQQRAVPSRRPTRLPPTPSFHTPLVSCAAANAGPLRVRHLLRSLPPRRGRHAHCHSITVTPSHPLERSQQRGAQRARG